MDKVTVVGSLPSAGHLCAFVIEEEKTICAASIGSSALSQARSDGFKAAVLTTAIVHPVECSGQTVVLVGLGKRKDISAEIVRRAAATAVKTVQALKAKKVAFVVPEVLSDFVQECTAVVEGAWLGSYKFSKYKSDAKEILLEDLSIVVEAKKQALAKQILPKITAACRAVCQVRDWVNEPPSALTPKIFAGIAKKIAAQNARAGIKIKLYEKADLEKMGMGAVLGVARGSGQEPVLVHLQYRPKKFKKKIALVGKGVTFDSGGLSLKPAQSMETMKMDMAGAASVLGVFSALAQWQVDVAVDGIMVLVENMPGGCAYKPGDVLRAKNGKTIEVLNTDAEGRLILADALCFAAEQKPDQIINMATLTGACLVALGGKIAGAMTNTDTLYKDFEQAANITGEAFWQLPLVEDYRQGLKSPVADLQNISSVRGEAGTIIGGLFLQAFVGDVPWMHLDIAGPAWADRESAYLTRGGTGFTVRTLLQYLVQQSH